MSEMKDRGRVRDSSSGAGSSSRAQNGTMDRDAIRIQAELINEAGGSDPFAAAVRATRMPMIVTNPRLPDNPVVFANDAFCRLCGYTRDEILGRNCRFLQGPETNPDVVKRIHEAVAEARSIEIDILNYRKQGEPFWNRLLLAPVRDAQGQLTYFFASQVDVTMERERLAGLESHNAALTAALSDRLAAQKESEDRLRFAAQAGRLGIWELDLPTLELTTSSVCREIFGREAGEVLTYEALRAAVHPDDRDRMQAAVDRSIASGSDYDIDYRILRPDGSEAWVHVRAQVLRSDDGKPLRMAGVSLDTTGRRRAELKLGLSEESLRLSNEAAEIGTWDLDLTANVLTWSDRTKAMFGISPGVACSMDDFYSGLHLDDRDEISTVFASALDPDRRAVYDVEYRTIGKEDGVLRWVAAKGRGLFDARGRCVRAIGTAINITARKIAEERQSALLRLGDQLRDLDDPAGMAFVAAETIGTALRTSRAGYGTYDDMLGEAVVTGDWTAPGISSIAGKHRMRHYGAVAHQMERGETIVICDGQSDQRTRAKTDVLAALSARAIVMIPLLEGGRLVALFFASDVAARNWSVTELDFLREVTYRTHAAVERRRAESALRAMNATLEARVAERTAERDRVWHNSRDLLVVIGADGIFRAVNPAWTAILGHRPHDVIGRSFLDFIWPDDADLTQRALTEAAGSHDLTDFENRYRHRDGTLRWISWRTSADGDLVYAYGRHITDEKMAQAALEESQSRLRAVFETSFQLQGLLALDGTMIEANPAALAAMKCELADVVGQKFWDTPWFSGTPGMPEIAEEAVSEAAQGHEIRQEIALQLPTGLRSFDFSVRPIRNPAGEIVAILPEAAEITERRRAEEALRQSQKMEAVGQLTGGIAHDFNNLLTGIIGALDLLSSRLAQGRTKDLERYMNAAQSAAKRAATLTHRLLAFSRRQTLDPRPTDVNRLISGMEDMIRRTMGAGIEIEVAGKAGLWPVLVDANQLENALLNLCINARDAMPGGGRLTIETANRWLDERAARDRDLSPGQYLALSVTDTGTGMAPEVIARAFDPFYTTKPLGMGTGLGLSMIYGFAQQSGGTVRIYSEPGAGTTMSVYLPRHFGEADVPETEDEPGSVRAGQDETVLVVDDEPAIRMLVTEVLEDLGYTALEAKDGVSALNILRSNKRIDLLVTDVGLPSGMNGRQVADAGRASRPNLKVLFITGYAENAAIGNGHLDPGMRVLTKPFAMEALAMRIRDMIEGR